MCYFYKNEKGLSLIWVLILVVVVGGLTAALLASSTHNIRFSVDEVDTSRAFYAAEAGVEHTRANLMDILANHDDNNGDENDYYEVINNNLNYSENFDVNYFVEYNPAEKKFRSTGILESGNNDYTQIIEFNIDAEALGEIAVLLNKYGSDNIDEYVNFRGQEKDFSRDNVALVEMGIWEVFLSENYKIELDDEYGITFPENLEEEKYRGWDKWETKDMSRINQPLVGEDEDGDPTGGHDDEGNPMGVYWYLTNNRVDVGDGATEWQKDYEYAKGDYVYIQEDELFYYYEAKVEHESKDKNKPGAEEDWEVVWEFLGEFGDDEDDNLDFSGNVTIKNSILIIDGSSKMLGDVTLKNTLVLVKDDIEFGGSYDLDESLILSFNDNEEETSLVTTGNPSIDLSTISLPVEHWPGIDNLIEQLEDNLLHFVLKSWRQVQ